MPIYSIVNILTWADAAQPLAAIGEYKKQYLKGGAVDLDLHLKIKLEKEILAWQYSQNPTDTDNILYEQGNYVYALLFPYLFAAQQATGGSGQIVNPTTTTSLPTPYDFLVLNSGTLFINGQSTATFPVSWKGFNIQVFRGGQLQSLLNAGGTYYTWDSVNAIMTISTAAVAGEIFQIYPVI